jgi:hypothetical protein
MCERVRHWHWGQPKRHLRVAAQRGIYEEDPKLSGFYCTVDPKETLVHGDDEVAAAKHVKKF